MAAFVTADGGGPAVAHRVSAGVHPRYRLDEAIHAPVRLSVMAALAAADRIDFRYLRDLVQVSDSLLSKHMSLLEEAGYVRVTKGYQGKRPRTWFSLTADGRAAFEQYRAALREIIGAEGALGQEPAATAERGRTAR
jgi:DNA-binding MarR family transcriptional regulator